MRAAIQARYGIEDEELKARAELSWMRASGTGLRLFGEREYRDAGDISERSGLVNSIAAQEFGSDATEPFDVRSVGLAADIGAAVGVAWRVTVAYEEHAAVRVVATPARGEYEPVIPALDAHATRVGLSVERPTSLFVAGTELRLKGDVRGTWFSAQDGTPSALRGFVDASLERPIGAHRLVSRTTFAARPRDLRVASGAGAGVSRRPGERSGLRLSRVRGRPGRHAAARVAAPPRPSWPVPLGRFGKSPPRMTLAPFAHTVYLAKSRSAKRATGWYPAIGIGALLFFDAIRLDAARGLRDGRWTFSVDLTQELWRVL